MKHKTPLQLSIERTTGVKFNAELLSLTKQLKQEEITSKQQANKEEKRRKNALKAQRLIEQKQKRKQKSQPSGCTKEKVSAYKERRQNIISFFIGKNTPLKQHKKLAGALKEMFQNIELDKKGKIIQNEETLDACRNALAAWYKAIGVSSVKNLSDDEFDALHYIGGFWRKLSQEIESVRPSKEIIAKHQARMSDLLFAESSNSIAA